MLSHPQNSGSSSARRARKRRVGLTAYQEHHLKEKLRVFTCSEPWVEAQFRSTDDVDQDGTPIHYRYHDPHVFPPGGSKTAMVRCPRCGVITPPNAIEHGACLDHADHRGWGPSPSAVAIQGLQMMNLRLQEPELPPEDSASLRREIETHLEGEKRAQQL